MKTRIYVRKALGAANLGRTPVVFQNLTVWDVSVESVRQVFRSVKVFGFMGAIGKAAEYLSQFPDAEVTLPQDLKNIQVVG
jgi:hypothetical protein